LAETGSAARRQRSRERRRRGVGREGKGREARSALAVAVGAEEFPTTCSRIRDASADVSRGIFVSAPESRPDLGRLVRGMAKRSGGFACLGWLRCGAEF
jgi:hypothetical protein